MKSVEVPYYYFPSNQLTLYNTLLKAKEKEKEEEEEENDYLQTHKHNIVELKIN